MRGCESLIHVAGLLWLGANMAEGRQVPAFEMCTRETEHTGEAGLLGCALKGALVTHLHAVPTMVA